MKNAFTPIILFLCISLTAFSQEGPAIPSYYPPFSWDRVPVYLHSGHSEGLTDEEVEFVATHCDFYSFELYW